jgi:hypothetical protein
MGADLLFAQQVEVSFHPDASRVIIIAALIVAAAVIIAAFIVRGRRG